MTFSHVDSHQNPGMVDVSLKPVTRRIAIAEGFVHMRSEVIQLIQEKGGETKKGPIIPVAIVAGIQAAKKCSDLIPMCHPVGLEDCKIDIQYLNDHTLRIQCTCVCSSSTGVEMEALTGVSIAALTMYDMCKSMDAQIRIFDIRLIQKTGGKSDFLASKEKTIAELSACILIGGGSKRMGEDKSKITYHGIPQWKWLAAQCQEIGITPYFSVRHTMHLDTEHEQIPDQFLDLGPLGGILSAFRKNPNTAWLVLACDLPYFGKDAIQALIEQRNSGAMATAFWNSERSWAEPLCAIYEPAIYPLLLQSLANQVHCPRKILQSVSCKTITPNHPNWIENVNTPEERAKVKKQFSV